MPVTPLELTDVYATFADNGVHHAPQAFEVARGLNGKVLKGSRLTTKGQRVLYPNVAELVAATYTAMGLLPEDRPRNWYDPGSFWSGDDLALLRGARLGPEVAVDVPTA